jgi:hypothetical protein
MNKIEFTELELSTALNIVSDLSELFDDRVSELHKVQGMQAERHAFVYYREKIWNIRRILQNAALVENENETK